MNNDFTILPSSFTQNKQYPGYDNEQKAVLYSITCLHNKKHVRHIRHFHGNKVEKIYTKTIQTYANCCFGEKGNPLRFLSFKCTCYDFWMTWFNKRKPCMYCKSCSFHMVIITFIKISFYQNHIKGVFPQSVILLYWRQ